MGVSSIFSQQRQATLGQAGTNLVELRLQATLTASSISSTPALQSAVIVQLKSPGLIGKRFVSQL